MAREMASHLAMLQDEYRRRGLSDDSAERAAREKFGQERRIQDLHRDARIPLWLEQISQDVRFTLRSLATSKRYTAICIVTLALGIGAASAVFSVVHPLMIEPLPFERPGSLVQLFEEGSKSDWAGEGERPYPLPPARLDEVAETLTTIDGIFQSYSFDTTLFAPGEPSRVRVSGVSDHAFSTLRVRPLRGRLFEPIDFSPGAEPVAVASHSAWSRYWDGAPEAIGSMVSVDLPTGRQSFRVIGVLPNDFALPIGSPSDPSADFWLPGNFSGHGSGSGLTTILRVRDDLDVAAASEEISALLSAMQIGSYRLDLATGQLSSVPAGGAQLVTLKEREIGRVRTAFLVLVAVVVMVLLIACMNVAGLMLGRMAARRRELAIRSSLGAGRWRLIRQVVTESLLLGTAGGAAGMLLAWITLRFLTTWRGSEALSSAGSFVSMPRMDGIELDGTVLAFNFSVALATGLLCGLTPALSVVKGATIQETRGGRPSFGSRPLDIRSRDVLIVAQFSLAMTLLICAGLLMKSFFRLAGVDPGFATANVVTFQVTASREHFRSTAPYGGGVGYFERLADDIGRLPGVGAVGYGPAPFMFGAGNGIEIHIPGSATGGAVTSVSDVSSGYLKALDVPLLRGRRLDESDGADRPLVMLVSEKFVEQHLNGRDPVGMVVETSVGRPSRAAEIIGVVGDIRRGGLDSAVYPQAYLDYRQASASGNVDYWWASFVVKTSRPDLVKSNVSLMVRQFDADARVDNMASLDHVVSDTIAAPRFLGWVFSGFAITAMALSLIGLYGTISYYVTQRTSEIGVRMALGADSRTIVLMILRRSAALAVVGISLGILSSVAGVRYISSILFGVDSTELVTYVALAASFLVVAVLAAWLPSRQATRISPVTALRHE